MALSPKIDAEVEKRFPERDRADVRTLLSDCEGDNLCLAVLRLSRGEVKRVKELVEAAKRDYRDVLSWASQPTRTYIVGLLRKGRVWSPEDENGRTHLHPEAVRNWKKSGAILVGGWFMDLGDPRGLYIFTVNTSAEAQALVQSDEAIRSGKLMFEFHPWLAPLGLRVLSSEEL